MREIQHLLKINVEFEVADGFEPAIQFPVKKKKNKPQPRKHGSRGRINGNANHKQKNQTDKTHNRYRDGMGSEKKTGKQTQARSNQSPPGDRKSKNSGVMILGLLRQRNPRSHEQGSRNIGRINQNNPLTMGDLKINEMDLRLLSEKQGSG